MAQILKFPAQISKQAYRPVRKRKKVDEDPDQLNLFTSPKPQILSLGVALSPFEHALMFDERGDDKAGEMYAKAIEEQDCVADAHCNLGIIESKRGNLAKAFDCFTTALKHDPRHCEAHYNLGNLYFDLNDFRLARVHFEMAIQVDPSFPNAYFNLALVQAINNEFEPALVALTSYQRLVSESEGRIAEELLRDLQKSLAGCSRLGST